MKRKILSLALALALLISQMPSLGISASAASSGTEMDALTALGIDSSAAPEGYDANSLDNPYGKNTIELAPVYELYKVGLQNKVSYPASYDTQNSALQSGNNTEKHDVSATNALQASLFGNAAWSQTTVSGIMGSGATSTVKSGTTVASGDYTLITDGTKGNVDSTKSPFATKGYLKDVTSASTDLGGNFKYALSSVASGNFDGNTGGLSAQTAMVYAADYSTNGGLYLRFGSATGGTYGSDAKTLLGTDKIIGNPTLSDNNKLVEDFSQNPYQLQNYLQVATGDWNNDGLDEVAVYIPESGNSRIVVYALQLNTSDDKATAYLNPAKWQVVWTYSLKEGAVVSNMVSLVSGDVNLDGTDDLAATWGYYYGPTQNIGSTAVVMFGAKGTELLKNSQQFNLTYGTSNIVRASFEFGDMAGSDSDVLILCGQSDADLKAGNTKTRYVALYDWNGTSFVSNVYQNFNLFEKDDKGNPVWPQMFVLPHNDKFYSLPLCTANTALIAQGLGGGSDLLYFDSLIIEYTDKGLSIKEAWDNTTAMQNTGSLVDYVEYGAVAGDFTGQTGAGALVTMTQTLSSVAKSEASYTVMGSHQEPVPVWDYYYRNWFYRLFSIETWYIASISWVTVSDTSTVKAPYEQLTMGKAYMVTVDQAPENDYINRTETDFSASICLANTDNDSSYMNYSDTHYYTYTDPQVLAVLASPPYFSDLMNRTDLSGGYAQSATTYSKTTGSGDGTTVSSTITLGAYVSFEHDFEVLGVKIASIEAEAQVTANFTFDWEKESTLEQTITYSATAGEDMVSFYSIPMEIYEYTSNVPDGKGGYTKVLTTVNIPHEAAVRLLSLAEYESIQKDYNVLPPIADNVLTHTLGDPATYPTSSAGYNVIAEYKGDPASVGFSSAASGSSISQEIAMSESKSTAFSASVAVEAKAGAGAGDIKFGVIAGAEVGAGFVKISTSGSSFSGDMQNMPIEAQSYGYGMNWRIFCYKYSDGGTAFPVVNYIVSEPSSPPPLPADFTQDMAQTTSNSVTLTWSYDKTVAGFRIYRYYEFPEGSGSYEVKFVPFSAAVRFDELSKTYYFSYKDENLSPYTEYKYQIKTVRADNPKESIYSEPMSCRTKTAVGYPTITLDGLVDGKLPIYPDDNGVVTLSIADAASYTGISYQWQKLVDGAWTDMSGRVDKTLTIANAGTADKGTYRCRINCIYYDTAAAQNYYISAYSQEFATAYAKRTPTASIFTAEEYFTPVEGGNPLDGLLANIELHSANLNHAAAPTGNVTFTVTGTDYEYSKTVALAVSSNTKTLDDMERKYSTASLSIASLPVGVYAVTAYYGGSRVFKDMETTEKVLVVIGNGSADRLDLAAASAGSAVTKFVYGGQIFPSLFTITKASDKTITETLVTNATYKYYSNNPADWDNPATTTVVEDQPVRSDFTAGSRTPNVGSYTLEAYVNDGTNDVLKATQTFTVGQKPITVSVTSQTNVDAGAVTAHPPQLTCTELTTTALAELNLTYSTTNSAGNVITLNNSTEPGNYTVTACTSQTTDAKVYNNYSVTYVSGTYTIIGATFRLTTVAASYTDKAGTRPVGTVGISNKTQTFADYAAKTSVMLYALPQAGYEVDTWTATFADNTSKTQEGKNTYTLTTEAQTCTVTVTFKPATITLEAIAQPVVGGTVSCSDEYFSSPAYVSNGAEYTFTATPKAGYHFNKWQILASGTTSSPAGTAAVDGSNTLSVTVGTASMTVYAYFTRDSYTLTLDGDITATYMYYDDTGDKPQYVPRLIPSGTAVPGDTEITILPKTGYQAAEGAVFIVNGTETTDSASHVFNITQNSTVSLDTVRNNYAVTVSAVNGAVVTKVNGVTASAQALAAVEGGSVLTFTAHADRGYVFDHWMLNDAAIPNSTETLTIAELGATTAVAAVFKANTPYPATAVVNTASRGTMKYTLYDIYGDLVGAALTDMPVGTPLTVYKGEKLVLTVAVISGNMIEQWEVNGTNSYTSQKTYTVDTIGAAINAKAYLKAASSYSVNFLVMGAGGTLTAKADDAAITTGSLQYGGSSLAFSAAPASGYMLDHWTVTAGGTTVAEDSTALDSDGKTMIAPVYLIDPLKQNLTVRAYFTTLVTNTVTLPSTTMGVSAITYVTPIEPTDDGTRNVVTENVRTGGTVIMTFTPAEHYGTSTAKIKTAIEKKVNADALVNVSENVGVFTATVKNLQSEISLNDSDLYYQLYSVTVPEHVTASVVTAKEGDTVTLTVTPASSYILSSLTVKDSSNADIALNDKVSSSKLSYTFTMPADDVSVEAEFTFVAPPAPGPGGGTEEKPTIPATGGGSTVDISVSVMQGLAALEMDADTLGDLSSFSGILSFDLSGLEDVTGALIPAAAFGAIAGANGVEGLSVKLPAAGVTFDSAALTAIGTAGSGDVTLTAKMLDTSTLTEEQQALVGDRKVIDLTLKVGSKTVSDFGSGTVEARVPYTLKPGESADAVVVWYLNDKGILESVTGRFDSASGSVVFETGHFSKYVIGSLPFDDVAREKWFFESVSFVYANGLFSGTGDLTFEPNTYMTRAMLVTVLWRLDGEPAEGQYSGFADVAEDKWYSEAVTWAAKNNIVSGLGNGIFAPDGIITREQIAVIMMNYTDYKHYSKAAPANLGSYYDSQNVSTWAMSAMQWANAEGLINGIGNNLLSPKVSAERCQVAAILQRFVADVVE